MSGSVKLMRLENKMNIQRQQGGNQRDWEEVRQHSDLPIITIITSTYNVVQDLHWTIDSIKKQTYPNIQWIIADGASTDGTVAMLGANNELIDYWFSEPDTGIYDAWNKALEHVKGDWVQFIGAGDELYETNTLEKVALHLKNAYPSYELVYGQVVHVSEKGRKELYVSGEPWENYQGKWEGIRPKLPPHPALFHNSSLFKEKKFNTEFSIVADSHFLMQNLHNSFLYIPLIVDRMVLGGISSSPKGKLESYKELLISLKVLKIDPPLRIKYKSILWYFFSKIILKTTNQVRYGQLMDLIKVMRGKPKVFTVD